MSLKVLVVDDDDMVVFLHKIMLKECGISEGPVVAYNGREALDYIVAHQQENVEFLLLLDINMPEMNAWQLLDELEKRFLSNRLLVIIVTSSVEEKDKAKAKNYPSIVDFIEKPINEESCLRLKGHERFRKYFSKSGPLT